MRGLLLIIGIILGIILHLIIRRKQLHGVNSRSIISKIYTINGIQYRMKPVVYACLHP